MRGYFVALGSTLLQACIWLNPDFEPADSASGSNSGSASGPASTSTAAPTSAGSLGESASSSDGGSASEGASATSGPTTGDMSAGTATAGATGTTGTGASSTTGQLAPCDQADQVQVAVPVVRDAYFTTSTDPACPWLHSDLYALNTSLPCQDQNYGVTRYAIIGTTANGRGEYVLDFGLAQVMQQYSGMWIYSARLEVVAWSKNGHGAVDFSVGALTALDPWFEGARDAALALTGDSNWLLRQKINENIGFQWSGGDGPGSSAAPVGTIHADSVPAGEHPVLFSSDIAGSWLTPWVEAADPYVGGFVITTDSPPLLIKNLDQTADQYDPKLHLVLCPSGA